MKRLFLINVIVSFLAVLFLGSCNNTQLFEDSLIEKELDLSFDESLRSSIEATDYYWYKDEKRYIKKKNEKQYIMYKKENKEKISTLKRSSVKSTFLKGDNDLNLSGIVLSKGMRKKYADIMWGIIENDVNRVSLKDTPEIIYHSFFYTSPSGVDVGISHLFYVKLKSLSDKDKLDKMADKYQVDILGNNEYLPKWYTLACNENTEGDALQMANLFYESGFFEASEPDLMPEDLGSFSTPNDTYYGNQWNLSGSNSINWLSAYQLTQGNNITVAVVDGGIEQMHPDLNNVYPLYDTYYGTWYATNIYEVHGTACAGIIGATVNNNKGVSGISPRVQILSVANLFGTYPNVFQNLATGISVAANSADVISNSWGTNAITNTFIEDAISYAFIVGRKGKGSVVVFATGNNNGNVSYPASSSYKDVIAVGAINKNGKRSSISNYGTDLDVVAPGENIPTTDMIGKNGYSSNEYYLNFGGTSAACPHVAAVAALILSVNNNLTYREVAEIIEKTARKIGGYSYATTSGRPNGTWHREMGYGVVDAYAAVLEARRRL